MIATVATGVGVFIAVLGLLGCVRPRTLMDLVESAWRPPWGPWAVAVARLLIGSVLLLAAPGSRFPTTVGVFACLAIIGGLAVPTMSRERRLAILGWWRRRHATFLRAWSVAALACGAFVVYACG